MAKGPSMLEQYAEIKAEHSDTVLFFRMGDFYEMFYDDAVVASEVLGITLTSRDKNSDSPVPMAGVPWHSVEGYLQRMLRAGYKVTLCEQAEELRPGEKILRRVVTRVYTPGSLYEEELIGEDGSALLASLVLKGDSLGIAVIDPSSGRASSTEYEGPGRFERMRDEILRWNPREIVMSGRDAKHDDIMRIFREIDGLLLSIHDLPSKGRLETLRKVLQLSDLGSLDLDSRPLAMEAAGLATAYLSKLHLVDAVPLREINLGVDSSHMLLDQTTLRNLELIHTLSGEKVGSLMHSIDSTQTWMGRRLLKEWLLRPLMNPSSIAERHSAVSSLVNASRRLREIRASLKAMRDLERLATRLAYNRVNGRDLLAISDCLSRMPSLQAILTESEEPLLNNCAEDLTALEPLKESIVNSLFDEQPVLIREGGMFRKGYDAKLDSLREKAEKGTSWLSEFEKKERERLEIPSLKVRFNRQFGYFIEVTKTHLDKVPEDWIRRQTMTNAERYITEELKEWEDIILNAGSRANEIEYRLFCTLRDEVKASSMVLSSIARKVSTIDVLASFAHHARLRSWSRPEIVEDSRLDISGARHPVLETDGRFVPNDVKFDKKRRFLLLTGPNMGGKSTYLRTTALITILAQAGSYVPANRARIGLVDRVFTRVGAHDDLRRGRSTFMMEMIEVAHILRRATPKSLVLLDEIGRGTSTFDGLAIAWSVTEDITKRITCRTLFATHYHQLVGLEEATHGLVNIHVQVADSGGEITFLHTVAEGPCDDSYGVQVASLAGLPPEVVSRARDLLVFLESQATGARAGKGNSPLARDSGQSSLFGWHLPKQELDIGITDVKPKESKNYDALSALERSVIQRLSEADPDMMSPRDAMDLLYELRVLMRGTHEWLEE
ncbi:MAG: DNA mismatch repair protein MutS [Candidatus Thalassarchaeaceae archaeon]|jgi:DNA mismatch repair protein MutS|nr:DNA mismatch repair protein MutS [Candidatus Thalassarchaeaceae archaeon]